MTKLNRRNKGDGTIVKKGRVFYLRAKNPTTGRITSRALSLNGVKCTTLPEAQAAAKFIMQERHKIESIESKQEMLVQIARNKQLVAALKFKVSDLWRLYLESPTRPLDLGKARMSELERVVGLFSNWCKNHGVETLADVDQDVVQRYLNEAGQGVSARSFNAYREILKCVFQHVFRQAGMDSNPVEGIQTRKMATQSRREFSAEQVEQIIKCFDTGFFFDSVVGGPMPKDATEPRQTTVEYRPEHLEEYRVIMLLAIFTGCRLGDACLMRWKSVDMENGFLEYQPRKTAKSSGKVVRLPLHPMLRTALAQAEEWKVDEYVCPNVAARYMRNQSGVGKTVQKLISCATGLRITADNEGGRARGASQYGMHSFRHTFVSFCANAGVPMAVVADIVGHGNPAMTEHYFHASNEVKAQAVGAIRIGPSTESPREEMHRLIDSADDTKVARILEFAKSL